MVSYLVKLLVLSLFWFFVIYNFYFNVPGHIENFDGYFPYLAIVWIAYAIYKYVQFELNESGIAKFGFLKLFWFFVAHLTLLSCLFFQFAWENPGLWFLLVFKILFYSLLPLTIVLISISFGKKALSYIQDFSQRDSVFQLLSSGVFGFFMFLFVVTCLWMLWLYNVIAVFGVLAVMLILSWEEFSHLTDSIFNYQFEYHINEWNYLKLISAEFLFIVATLLLSTNLINIVRPFPIGWDDLGVYMNKPNLFAHAWSLLWLNGMNAWQTFTGIGYMFKTPVQAFFLNNVWGIISFLALVLITGQVLKNKLKSSYIHIPLLLATIFISLPMIVFQQAKDMKLDTGLFFVSIISLYMLYEVIIKWVYEKQIDKKSLLQYLWVIGILIGFAFTIKFTSLLLISAAIWVFVYSKFKLEWFLGYIAIYFAIFTKADLWGHMNVVYPSENIVFVNSFSLISFLIWAWLVGYSLMKYKTHLQTFFVRLWVLLLGIFIALLPWVGKNIYTASSDISLWVILTGQWKSFQPDYTLLYSQEELEQREKNRVEKQVSAEWTSQNEDLWRYFGYEKGINNYVKLPWNLTMQLNQWGEFTGISYLFLALIPALLLFLPYKRRVYAFAPVLFIAGIVLLHMWWNSSDFFTQLMEKSSIPWWYGIILALFLLPVVYLHYTLKDTEKNKLFLLNIVFFSFYTFLWSIAAFGIVWYGIVLYFNMLLMIGFGIYYISSYKQEETEKEKQVKMFGSIIIFVIIAIWIFNSVFPHTFNNIKNAGYKEFKQGLINTTEAPFSYHREYLPILFALNIKDEAKQDLIKESISDEIRQLVPTIDTLDITTIKAILEKIHREMPEASKIARDDLNTLYSAILNPSDDIKSDEAIYRIGTFLKYYITENNKRLLEDSLVTQFDTYIYNGNADATVDNLKKLGLWYLLVDLNAATIDNDPRHALTQRYENLLRTFSSDKLELVDTDSMCLRIALDDYKSSDKWQDAFNHYMRLAGVNYESYDAQGNQIGRREKLGYCYNYIIELVQQGKVDENNYSYLNGIAQQLRQIIEQSWSENVNQDVGAFLTRYINQGYKVLFKVK